VGCHLISRLSRDSRPDAVTIRDGSADDFTNFADFVRTDGSAGRQNNDAGGQLFGFWQ
jgi:hypothetical protein